MFSSSHNLIVATLACIGLLLATPVSGQSGISAYQSSQIIDHSSMSPDSWSAPSSSSVIPYAAPVNTVPYSATFNPPATTFPPAATFQQPSNTAATLPRSFAPTGQTAGAVLSRQADTLVNRSVSTQRASPSIPDLGAVTAKRAPQKLNSLLRQPDTAGNNAVSQSPFRPAKHSQGSQTRLPLNAGQVTPANPFRATAGKLSNSPQVPSTATGEFNLIPAVKNPQPTKSILAPAVTSPAIDGASTLNALGRYPLGINSNLPTAPQTTPRITNPSPPTTYQNLLNQQVTTQPRLPSAVASAPFGPVVAQPTFSTPQPVLIPQPVLNSETIGSLPTFRPDLGHRSPSPSFRGRDHDNGLKMDFEDKKKEYPGLGEILATGRYFGSVSGLFLQPAFQQNSAITQFNSSAAAATFASSESFDFDYETAPRFRLGFESEFGPGVELDYWQFDQGSNISSFTSNGLNSGQLSSGLFGPGSLTTLSAVNAGETLSAIHAIDIETFSITFFKEIKFPISRLNGIFGFQYASVFQELDAELTDAGGAVIGAIRSTSDLRAYGPKLKFEYYRPIGHTNLEFVTAFGGSVLFGERDQIITNNQTPAVNQFGADEFVLTSDFYGGVQWKKLTAENRAYYVRLGVTHQSWIGGGSAVSANDNFGLRGFAFEVGLNR